MCYHIHLPFISLTSCLAFGDYFSLDAVEYDGAVCPYVRGRFRLISSYPSVVPLKNLYRLIFHRRIYRSALKIMN
jgi:hypothetical protein